MAAQSQYPQGPPQGGPPPGGPTPAGPPAGPSTSPIDKTTHQTRRFSPGFFGLIALCFLLPFLSITCTGTPIATLKGLDFVTGAEIKVDKDLQESLDFGEGFGATPSPGAVEEDITEDVQIEGAEDDRVDRNVFAIAALAAAGLGIILTLILKRRGRDLAALILASLVVLSLLIFRFDTSGEAEGGEGVVALQYRYGWWLALLIALVLIFAHFWGLRGSRASSPPGGAPPGQRAWEQPQGPPPGTYGQGPIQHPPPQPPAPPPQGPPS
jgi:hypothetical protein